MERKYTIYDFFSQVFFIFGITIACLSVFVLCFGADAKNKSTIFSMGREGLSIVTMGQYFLMSFLLVLIRVVLFTDIIIKNWSVLKRTIGMFVLIILLIGGFAYGCGWFPVNELLSWVMFLICFLVCATASIILSSLKEKKENEKLQEALEKMKRGEL